MMAQENKDCQEREKTYRKPILKRRERKWGGGGGGKRRKRGVSGSISDRQSDRREGHGGRPGDRGEYAQIGGDALAAPEA